MHNYKCSFWTAALGFSCLLHTTNSDTSYPPVTVHITNPANNNSTNLTNASAQQSVSQQLFFLHTATEQVNTYKNTASRYLLAYKYHALLGTIGACYASLWIQLYLHKKYIQNNLYWAKWRESITNTQLLEESSKTLTSDLLYAIQEHYVHHDEPVNPLLALACFMNDAAEEKKILDEYERITSMLEKMHLTKSLPYVIIDKNNISRYSERLAFISYIFKTWTINQRFDSLQLKREIII